MCSYTSYKVRKREKIRNQYNQAPHLTQDTNGKVTSFYVFIKVSLFIIKVIKQLKRIYNASC